MRSIVVLSLSAIVTAIIFAGCDPDNRGVKVAPQSDLDPKSEIGYKDNYPEAEVAGESRHEPAGSPGGLKKAQNEHPDVQTLV